MQVPFAFHGHQYVATLHPKSPIPVSVSIKGRTVARCAKSTWQPWRLEVADVDGDGRWELIVGVNKSTKYLPERHRTTFVYGFDGQQISEKWLGSTLGRPLLDFCFGPEKPGGQDLYTLQTTRTGDIMFNRYHWHGFGFRKTSTDLAVSNAKGLRREGKLIAIIATDKSTLIDPATLTSLASK